MDEDIPHNFFNDLLSRYLSVKQNNKESSADNDRFAKLTFNTGEMYRLSWESGFAKFRRFLAVNPNIRFSNLNNRSLNKTIRGEALSAVFTRLFALDPPEFSTCRPLFILSSGSQGISRNCPECTKIGFHTDFFEYSWVERCPVHNIPLVEECPGCNKPWPIINQYNARDCYYCTKLRPIKLGDMKKIRQNHNQAISQFESWKHFIDQSPKLESSPQKIDLSSFQFSKMTSKFRRVCLSDRDALEYGQHFGLLHKERNNEIKTETSQIISKTFNVTSISRKLHGSDHYYLDKYLTRRKKWIKGPRRRVLGDIVKFCVNHASSKHVFHRQTIFSSHLHSDHQVKICPYCFSINLWLDTTTNFALSYEDNDFHIDQYSIDDLLREAPSYNSLAFVEQDVGDNHLIIEDAKNNQAYLKWSLEYHLRGWFIEIFTSVNYALPAFEEEELPQLDCHRQFGRFLQSRLHYFWNSINHFGTIRTFNNALGQVTVTGKHSLLPSFDDLFKLTSYSGLSCKHYFDSTEEVLDSDERARYNCYTRNRLRRFTNSPVYYGGSSLEEVKNFIKARRLNRQHLEDKLKQIILEFAEKSNDSSFRKRLRGSRLP